MTEWTLTKLLSLLRDIKNTHTLRIAVTLPGSKVHLPVGFSYHKGMRMHYWFEFTKFIFPCTMFHVNHWQDLSQKYVQATTKKVCICVICICCLLNTLFFFFLHGWQLSSTGLLFYMWLHFTIQMPLHVLLPVMSPFTPRHIHLINIYWMSVYNLLCHHGM